MADGGARPVRKVEGQNTLLSRTMHSIQYNEIRDEFTVPLPLSQAIVTFRGDADGNAAPLRVIQGPKSRIGYIQRLALDAVHNEIFVPLGDTVLVFPADGNGDVPPIRELSGPDVGFGGSRQGGGTGNLMVDPVNNVLVVSVGGRLLIHNRTAEGNAKPLRAIGGPKSGMMGPTGPFAVYPPKGWIILGQDGDAGRTQGSGYIAVWNINDNGDVPPKWKIGGPGGPFLEPRGVTLNPKHKEIIASDKRLNAVMTFYFPEMF